MEEPKTKFVKIEEPTHHKLALLKVKYKFKSYTALLEYLVELEEKSANKAEE